MAVISFMCRLPELLDADQIRTTYVIRQYLCQDRESWKPHAKIHYLLALFVLFEVCKLLLIYKNVDKVIIHTKM